MKACLITVCLLLVAGTTLPATAQSVSLTLDTTSLQQRLSQAENRIILEYLDEGRPSTDAISAYHLVLGLARQQGLRLSRTSLRTQDERHLGSALLIQRLESLGLDYPRIYRLNLAKP